MCLFCKIASGEIPAKIAFQDEDVVVFHDIQPQAPTHLLVIPRKHVSSLAEANADHQTLLGKLLLTASSVAKDMGLDKEGYRVVINTGPGAGQTVFHIHVHVLGGRVLSWPPG